MTHMPMSSPDYRHDLGGGLILRWSTAADYEAIAQLYGYVFREHGEEPLNQIVAAWTRDMMSGAHPLIQPHDFAIVEDRDRGIAVAATCLLTQTWEYLGIPFDIGRPEIVASHPEYRDRGLVRAIFELIHARSAANGHMVQAITGIPYYYRQFGYEYALDLEGNRGVYLASIPQLKAGVAETYTLRRVAPADIPRLMALYDRDRARPSVVTTRVDEAYWRWSIDAQRPPTDDGVLPWLIVGGDAQPVGYVLTKRMRRGEAFVIYGMGVDAGTALTAVMPSVLRGLQTLAMETPSRKPDDPPPHRLAFVLGRAHPAYDVLGEHLAPRRSPPYAWYVRVPDLPAFLKHIAPALDQRLAASALSGYTGELRLDFYRGGLRLAFNGGHLSAVEPWRPNPQWKTGSQAGFPPLVFLQLLFGHRSLHELCYAFHDVWAEDDARPVLDVLFPAQASWVLPLE